MAEKPRILTCNLVETQLCELNKDARLLEEAGHLESRIDFSALPQRENELHDRDQL